jgi:hypothetical protein
MLGMEKAWLVNWRHLRGGCGRWGVQTSRARDGQISHRDGLLLPVGNRCVLLASPPEVS